MKTFKDLFDEAESRPEHRSELERIELLERIGRRPDMLGGKPYVRGTRLAVEHVLGYLVAGQTAEWLTEEFALDPDDVRACLEFHP